MKMKKKSINLAFIIMFLLFFVLSLCGIQARAGNTRSEESVAYATSSNDSKARNAIDSLRILFPEFEGFIVFGYLGGNIKPNSLLGNLYSSTASR